MGWNSDPLVEEATGGWNKDPIVEDEDEPQWSDLPGNIIPSAGKLVSDTAAVINPYNWDDIAANLYELGPSGIANFFKERYYDNPKKTLIEDPLGVVADAAGLLTGAGMAARAPGTLGRVAATAGKIGKHIDPLTGTVPQAVAKGVGKSAGKAASAFIGMTTGAGERPVKIAAQAGFQGGRAADAFKAGIKNTVEPEEIVGSANRALGNINTKKNVLYQGGMDEIIKDRTPVSFAEVDKALAKSKEYGMYTETTRSGRKKSYVHKPEAVAAASMVQKIVDKWRARATKDGGGFANMRAFDAMKQEIWDAVERTEKGSLARIAATNVFHSVREAIIDVSKTKPITRNGKQMTYADIMREYDTVKDTIAELQGTLSLRDGATVDTALRKLQSIMRDTAHTNYGARAKLVQLLVDHGATDLLEHLAGQSLRPGLKPSLAAQVGGLGTIGGVFTGTVSPQLLLTLVMYSPALMGRGAYVSGNVAGKIVKPALAWEKFLQDRGLSSRGIAMAGRQVGMLEDAGEEQGQARVRFGQALTARAQELGYNIHPSVIESLAADLASENREDYERGIRTIGSNPRIAKMIMEAGGQGG